MSKKSNTAEVQNEVETTSTAPATKVETKQFPIPIDGSKGQEFITAQGGVSKAIRVLTEKNFSRGEVAKMLGKRYQHVRNVLITPVKKTS